MDRVEGDNELGRVTLYLAFARAAFRYWTSVFPRVVIELRRRRKWAERIPDPARRALALEALAKRNNLEGAAAFAVLAPRRTRKATIRALVAFQAIYNYTDLLAEQPAQEPLGNARRLHEALPAALDPRAGSPRASDGMAPLPPGDGGYLADLIAACRKAVGALPSYAAVRSLACEASERIVLFQSLSMGRDGELERWARQWQGGRDDRATWWEIAAAAGSSLPIHALIAAAALPSLAEHDVARLCAAYSSGTSALHSLLDSVVDRAEDAATGQLSLVGCYASPEEAADRLVQLAREAVHQAGGLPQPSAHLVLVTAMVCSYLEAATQARATDAASIDLALLTERMAAALGPVVTPVMLVFRLRRLAVRLGRALRPRAGQRESAHGLVPVPLTPPDPEPQGADARAA